MFLNCQQTQINWENYCTAEIRPEVVSTLFVCFSVFYFSSIPVVLHLELKHFARSLARSLVRSFVRSLARSFVRSFVRSLVRSFIRSFVRSFVRSLARSLVRSFVRSFARSLARRSVGPLFHLNLTCCSAFFSCIATRVCRCCTRAWTNRCNDNRKLNRKTTTTTTTTKL